MRRVDFIADMTVIDWLGILGSLMIAGAYFAVSSGRADPEAVPFHLLNLGGAVLILLSLWYRPNAGAIMIEVLWAAIAIWALARITFARKG